MGNLLQYNLYVTVLESQEQYMFIHYFQHAYSLIKYMTSVGSYVSHSILLFNSFTPAAGV